MTDVLAPLAGMILLTLVGVDVLLTVFHPEGHGGPFTRRQNRIVWRLWKRLGPRGAGRAHWLALGGPLLSVLTPAVWALLLILGYALIYYPWVSGFLVSPGILRAHWAEALYFSGVSATTLGTGDVVPDSLPLRLLSPVEALSGFALLSSSLSYILAVHGEIGAKTTLASELATHFSVAAEADDQPWQRERWLEHVAEKLLHLTHAHAQYPILHYYRSAEPRNSLPLQLTPLVRRAFARGMSHPGASHGERALLVALERYLSAAESRFLPEDFTTPGEEDSGLPGIHRRLLAYLGYHDAAAGDPTEERRS